MNEFPEGHVKVPSWELFILHIAKRSWPAGDRLSGTILHATNICRKTFEQERQNNRNLRGGERMDFTDEKDYIMRIIKEMVRVLFSLVFGKKYVSVEIEKENKYEVSGKKLQSFLDMIDSGQINEAENILLNNIDYTNKDEVMAAALFYQHLSEKDSEFLENNNYTKEEVLSGFKQLLVQSGYQDLFYMLKDDE